MNPRCEIKLDIFQGPLDLLLHLINKNKLDVTNLPISLVTAQYLEYLEIMKTLNIVVAGEYLFIAATLCHIKSKILLPIPQDKKDEDNDPRLEIVKPLKEFIVIKKIAASLDKRPLLGRDVFIRKAEINPQKVSKSKIKSPNLNNIIRSLKTIIKRNRPIGPPPIKRHKITINEQIKFILNKLTTYDKINLFEISPPQKEILIANFLAVLELAKNKKIKIKQESPSELIVLKMSQ